MELRHATSIVSDHTFARRVAVAIGLLTAVATFGVVGVAIARDESARAARTRDIAAKNWNQEQLRHTQWELDEYAGLVFTNWARNQPPGACPKNLLEVNFYAPHLHAVDPWGMPYKFYCTNGVLSLRAAGTDRLYDTADDLTNTSKRP
jgi:hypothetical protein